MSDPEVEREGDAEDEATDEHVSDDVQDFADEVLERVREEQFWPRLFAWMNTPAGNERVGQMMSIVQAWASSRSEVAIKETATNATMGIENLKRSWMVGLIDMAVRNFALVGSMGAILVLAETGKLDQTTVGFFSAIVGYVLGRQAKQA